MGWMLTAASLANSLGSLPLVALGLWVALLRPRTRTNLALGLLAAGFGVGWAFHWSVPTADEPLLPLWFLASTLGFLAGAVGAALVGAWFPRPLGAADGPAAALAGAIAAVYVAASLLAMDAASFSTVTGIPYAGAPPWWGTAWLAAFAIQLAAWWAALVLLAHRFRACAPGAGRERRQLALMSAAMLVYLAFRDATFWTAPSNVGWSNASGVVALAVVTALWLRNSRGPDGALARNVALWGLGMALTARLWVAALGGFAPVLNSPAWGLLRLAAVGILAYAILRHQLLGIDLKVRWTIKQSTVAAAFIGVFFVVSEGAQTLFSESLGPMVGIAAAGALVFAMAPLQRVAERVAEKAVPPAGEPAPAPAPREDSFRAAVRLAMKDGRLSASEQRALVILAADLRIPARQAYDVMDQVAAELAAVRGRRVEVER